ncbi:MAG: hypothetical protein IJW04_04875 [Ruminococcus sp.]|nr:hypothetical protein [Ruminococcus sp.]
MKKAITILLSVTLLLFCVACTSQEPDLEQNKPPVPGENHPNAPTIVLNGKELDVYTSHYNLTEEYAFIPLAAFLHSIGAEYADSPLNEYGTQCYSFDGKQYVVVPDMHLFILENDYNELVKELDAHGKKLSRETVEDKGLLPKSESKYPGITNATVIEWAVIMADHVSVENALKESGVDINIEYDYANRTITVIMPN